MKHRRSLTLEENRAKSQLIVQQAYEVVKDCHCIALYASLNDEVFTFDFIERLLEEGKEILLPKTRKEGLTFHLVTSLDELEEGNFHVLEPTGEERAIQLAQVVFVPLVGFDEDCQRIGYGKGYYDRALRRYRGLKVGLAFDCKKVERIPVEELDIPLDRIITESGTY